jgi:uncharacterized protein (TIGR03435 family)
MAYDIRNFQISGGPGWVNSERYDIVAKSSTEELGDGTGDSQASIGKVRLRLQALLAERFQLKVSRVTKELPVYVLTVGRNGPKLVEGQASRGTGSAPAGIQAGCGQMTGTNTSMANLAYKLSKELDRVVLDRTGLSGEYNFRLLWAPELGPCSVPGYGGAESALNSSGGPSIFTAIEEQLGLKLEAQKGPVDVIVINRIEAPSAN